MPTATVPATIEGHGAIAVNLLRETGKVTPKQLATAAGIKIGHARNILARLQDRGIISKIPLHFVLNSQKKA